MKKVDNIRLGVSPITDKIFAGFLNETGNKWLDKKDVTQDFLKVVIDRFGGYSEIISDDEEHWEITVKKITKKQYDKRLQEDTTKI